MAKSDVLNETKKTYLKESSLLFTAKGLKANVIGYETKIAGMFATKYTLYMIKTVPFNCEVKRRYSDFFWLREILSNLYPYLIVFQTILIIILIDSTNT